MSEINWEALKRDWEADEKSNRALAVEYGCAESTIRKRATKKGWKRKSKKKVESAKKVPLQLVRTVRTEEVRTEEVRTDAAKEGNPTKKTVELLEAIFEAIAAGKSTRRTCSELGISLNTFFRWVRTDREFRYQYACAKEFCADFFVEDVIEIADDSSRDVYINEKGNEVVDHEVLGRAKLRMESRYWAAERLHPKKYNSRFLETLEGEKSVRRIEVQFVTGDGQITSGRTFDSNGKLVSWSGPQAAP